MYVFGFTIILTKMQQIKIIYVVIWKVVFTIILLNVSVLVLLINIHSRTSVWNINAGYSRVYWNFNSGGECITYIEAEFYEIIGDGLRSKQLTPWPWYHP